MKPLAEQGNAAVQFMLGGMYQRGLGVVQNDKEAVKWLGLSAKQGTPDAQRIIGLMCKTGKGVMRDYLQGHKWFNIASTNGHKSGAKFRGLIEKRMTPDQIAEANRLARKWIEEHKKD